MPKFELSVSRRTTTYERLNITVEAASEQEIWDKFVNGDGELWYRISDTPGKEEIDDCNYDLDGVDLVEE